MDYFMGLPRLANLTLVERESLRRLAVHNMFGRLFYTDAQKTYMAGSLPAEITTHFEALLSGQGVARLRSFHGHREMLHAFAFFFNVSLDLPGPRLMPYIPEFDASALPPSRCLLRTAGE